VSRCASCNADNRDTAQYCDSCGRPLDSAGRQRETRKTVTVLFADIVGSTPLGERLDPELLRGIMARYFETVSVVLTRHGATVEKFIGDAVMAVFGVPTLHEDDALRAVRAADEIRVALQALNRELQAEHGVTLAVRIGINTGEAVAGDPRTAQSLVTGDAVNTAARLEQAAAPGDILVARDTYLLVRDAVAVEPVDIPMLKGKVERVQAVRLLDVTRGAEGHARRLDAPMVGRQRELGQLRQAFKDVIAKRTLHLFVLLGAAGIGKSKLVHEFVVGISQRATVLRGRCLPYGEGITFWPIAEALRSAAGITDDDNQEIALGKLQELLGGLESRELVGSRIGQAIGLARAKTAEGSKEEVFWAVQKVLERRSLERPLVLVFDDLQWAEPTFLDLVEHLADWSRGSPILLLCMARPELLDVRPAWAAGRPTATTVLLEPLPADEAGTLMERLPGGLAIDRELRARISEAAEGNPLFVEEMLAMLIDGGVLRSNGAGEWVEVGDLAELEIPGSVQAVLAARLDRLDPLERAVAERGSVVGRVFERRAVTELTPEDERDGVAQRLMALVRKELVRPDPTGAAEVNAFRFRHLLIRDAAYGAIPKSERAALHERFASWLEHVTGDRLDEYVEIVAYHFEEAYRYRAELGVAHQYVTLAIRALDFLVRAARKGEAGLSFNEAARLYERALRLHRELPSSSADQIASRGTLIERTAEAMWRDGRDAQAAEAIRTALASGEDLGNDTELGLLWERLGWYLWDAGEGSGSRLAHEEALRRIPHGSAAARARALAGMARVQMLSLQHEEAITNAGLAVGLARGVNDRSVEADALNTFGIALSRTGKVDEGIDALRKARDIAEQASEGAGSIRAFVNLAVVLSENGQRAASLSVLLKGYEAARRFGLHRGPGVYLVLNAAFELTIAGRLDEADELLGQALSDGLTGLAAARALSALAEVQVYRGDLSTAAQSFAAARAIARGAGTGWDVPAMCAGEAELAAEQSRYADGIALLEEGLAAAFVNDWQMITRLHALGLRLAADEAARARARFDSEAEMAVMRTGRSLTARLETLERDIPLEEVQRDKVTAVRLAMVKAERARLERLPEAEAWAVVAARAADADYPYARAYALIRQAEVSAAANERASVEELLREAHRSASQASAARLIARIDELGDSVAAYLALGSR
jgi:class 3 adenylate cyclase/tetratricopeptide (TPR) repeat protein